MPRDTVFSASTITFYLDLHPLELGGGRTSHPLCKSNCWLVEMKVQDVLSGHETVVFAWTSGSPVDARPVYSDSDADTLLSGWKGGGGRSLARAERAMMQRASQRGAESPHWVSSARPRPTTYITPEPYQAALHDIKLRAAFLFQQPLPPYAIQSEL